MDAHAIVSPWWSAPGGVPLYQVRCANPVKAVPVLSSTQIPSPPPLYKINVDGAVFSVCKDAGVGDDVERVTGALSKKIQGLFGLVLTQFSYLSTQISLLKLIIQLILISLPQFSHNSIGSVFGWKFSVGISI